MTAEINNSSEIEAVVMPPPGPGAMLREAREAKKMSIKDVQTALRLDEPTVKALESDNYESFSAPIFVKGYLRSYARLLEVNESRVVAGFESHAHMAPPPLVPLAAHGSGPRTMMIPWRMLFIGISVTVLLGLAWMVYRMVPEFGSGEEPVATANELLLARPMPDVVSEEAAPKVETLIPVATETVTALPDGQVMAESELALDFESQTPLTEAPDESVAELEAAPVAGLEAGTESAAAVETTAEAGTDVVSAGGATALLQLTVSEESWIEVDDASGRHLIYGLLKPGQVRRVSGRLPYRVLLGNADGVELMFDGELFDYQKFKRQNVARFTLGE